MYVKTAVFERDIQNRQYIDFKHAVVALALELIDQCNDETITDELKYRINTLDFSKPIRLEWNTDDAGLTIDSNNRLKSAYAWSNHKGDYDAIVFACQPSDFITEEVITVEEDEENDE